MNKEAKEYIRMRFKMLFLDLVAKGGNVAKTCRGFNVTKSTFYKWERAYTQHGREGLRRRKPIAYNHPNKIGSEIVNKILELRREYQLGPERIKWYLERYQGITISESSVSRTLVRHGVSRLPKTASRRSVHI